MKTTKIRIYENDLFTNYRKKSNRLRAKPSRLRLLVERGVESISEFSSDV